MRVRSKVSGEGVGVRVRVCCARCRRCRCRAHAPADRRAAQHVPRSACSRSTHRAVLAPATGPRKLGGTRPLRGRLRPRRRAQCAPPARTRRAARQRAGRSPAPSRAFASHARACAQTCAWRHGTTRLRCCQRSARSKGRRPWTVRTAARRALLAASARSRCRSRCARKAPRLEHEAARRHVAVQRLGRQRFVHRGEVSPADRTGRKKNISYNVNMDDRYGTFNRLDIGIKSRPSVRSSVHGRHATSSASREGPNRALTRRSGWPSRRGRAGRGSQAAPGRRAPRGRRPCPSPCPSYHCGAREQWVSLDRVGERVRVAHCGAQVDGAVEAHRPKSEQQQKGATHVIEPSLGGRVRLGRVRQRGRRHVEEAAREEEERRPDAHQLGGQQQLLCLAFQCGAVARVEREGNERRERAAADPQRGGAHGDQQLAIVHDDSRRLKAEEEEVACDAVEEAAALHHVRNPQRRGGGVVIRLLSLLSGCPGRDQRGGLLGLAAVRSGRGRGRRGLGLAKKGHVGTEREHSDEEGSSEHNGDGGRDNGEQH
eukprot:scaffold58033_cov63-Phaeocystis_antarctica.AAC.3